MNAALLILAAYAGSDWSAAQADRANFTPAEQGYIYHVTTENVVDPAEREKLTKGFKYAIASFSPQDVLEYATPVSITPTLMRLDLRACGVTPENYAAIVNRDPYKPVAGVPGMSRADWLLLQLCDATESDAYYRFAFGGKPKNLAALVAQLGIDTDPKYQFGLIESKSGVSVQGRRWIASLPILRGYAYQTKDVRDLTAHKDPGEQPEGDFDHDAEEWLIYRPKVGPDGSRGVMLSAILADGKQNLLDRADVEIVVDHQNFRNTPEIRVPGSCLGCHARGPLAPTENLLKAQITAGIDRYAYSPFSEQIERFHFGDVATELQRTRDDLQKASLASVGLFPAEASEAIKAAIARYDQPVDLARMAQEHFIAPDKLLHVLALESATSKTSLPVSVAGLGHGMTMPREAAEEASTAIDLLIEKWAKP